ncbi:hypothetical protein RhiirA1_538306 [Rhizophagus irregularis]|uniref:Uncharacterized protein n=1 Tax=Rhizophagus irregularis TaxID=588596 RepID=A0A2N0RH88_9GLOM|nr:hypothetical protein RhiirA1_538306 [Rhizophagus irregularis]
MTESGPGWPVIEIKRKSKRSSSVVANKKYRIAEIGFFGCVLWFIGRGILVSSIHIFYNY